MEINTVDKGLVVYAEPNGTWQEFIKGAHIKYIPRIKSCFLEDGASLVNYLESLITPEYQKGREFPSAVVINHLYPGSEITWGTSIVAKYADRLKKKGVPMIMFYSEVHQMRKHFMGETALKNGAKTYFRKGDDDLEKLFNFLKEEIYGRK